MTLAEFTVLPPYLRLIQPSVSHVWSIDQIGIDLNRKCTNIVCTYMYMADNSKKIQIGEHTPFWCTILLQLWVGGPFTGVHYGVVMSKDLLLYLPNTWGFYCNPSGYIDRDRQYKSIKLFTQKSGIHKSNKQIILFEHSKDHSRDRSERCNDNDAQNKVNSNKDNK